MHGVSLDDSYLCDATHAHLELFYSLAPDVQQKVYYGEFSSEEVRGSRNHRCNPRYGSCMLKLCLCGFFSFDGSIEEYAHYRQHGMCSRCKARGERRLARRKERLEGYARLNQAILDGDREGMSAHGHWSRGFADYGQRNVRRSRNWTRSRPSVTSPSGWSGLTASYIAWTRGSSLASPGSCRSIWA